MELEKKPNLEYLLNDRSGDYRYRILADLNSKLRVLDKNLGRIFSIDPIDIVLNNEHVNYSPDDILRIGFIFGQDSIKHALEQ